MYRFSTPTHKFELPIDTGTIEDLRIIYTQNNNVVFRKQYSECEFAGNFVSVRLTQEDTTRFSTKYPVNIQLHIRLKDGNVIVTEEIHVTCKECLDGEEI